MQTKECCSGFYGQQCLSCPGKAGSPCFGNGICLDGFNGTGVCQCGEGFTGTACENCIIGKYGPRCDQGTYLRLYVKCPCDCKLYTHIPKEKRHRYKLQTSNTMKFNVAPNLKKI